MPYLLIGYTLLRFNLLQRMKTKRRAVFFKSLIYMKKDFFDERFYRHRRGSNACLKYL
jgi:hypothetical protein